MIERPRHAPIARSSTHRAAAHGDAARTDFGLGSACRAVALALALSSGAMAAAPAAGSIDVNTATLAEIESIRGIGPAVSARILAERARAPFSSWADLMARVRGIRSATAARFSADGMTVGGVPYSGRNAAAVDRLPDDAARGAASGASR